jgi:hypothetical protein
MYNKFAKKKTEDLLDVVFSLQSNVKLHKDDNTLLRTVESSQTCHAKT